MPSSSPAGASSNMPGASASVYTPVAQPQADQSFQNIFQQSILPYALNPATSPGGVAYAQAQPAVGSFAGSPYGPQAVGSAQTAYDYYSQILQPQSAQASNSIFGNATNAFNAAQNNPFYGQALTGAQNAATQGGILGTGDELLGNALSQGGQNVLQTAFDPQNALYNRLVGQATNQQNAANAFSGVGSTPYGASVLGDRLNNLNIDWKNQQLGRQTQGLGAAGTAFDRAGGLWNQGVNLTNTSAALPGQAYNRNLADTAGLSSQAAGLIGQGLNLGTQGAQGLATFGAGPQNASAGNLSSLLQALGSQTNLGNNQFVLPQQALNDIESYLKLGQSASGISGQLGQLGLNQQQNALQGLGGVAGSLFGGGGSGGGGNGFFGNIGSSLFGGSGAGTVDSLAASAGSPSLASLGLEAPFSGGAGLLDTGFGAADLGIGTAAADAGGGGLLSFLPGLALSG